MSLAIGSTRQELSLGITGTTRPRWRYRRGVGRDDDWTPVVGIEEATVDRDAGLALVSRKAGAL